MKEKSSENTSIADGYFTKPALLIVDEGHKYIQLNVTGADMIKSLGTPSGPVEITDEDDANDERDVQFKLEEDLSELLLIDMHVVVPDLYDMEHQARAAFDVDSIEEIDPENLEKWPGDEDDEVKVWDEDTESDGLETPEGGEEEKASDEEVNQAEENRQADIEEEDNTLNLIWIVTIIIGIIIVSMILWLMRRSRK